MNFKRGQWRRPNEIIPIVPVRFFASRKVIIATAAALSASWLILVCLLAQRFAIPSGDGILYALPLAVAKQPFDLGIPFLGNFDGYGCAWGHHWPGAMWLRGAIFSMLPYGRMADIAVLSLCQLLTALTAACLVWAATRKVWPVAACVILILSDRLLLLACAGNRFESISVAVVLLWFANSVTRLDQQHARWRWLARAMAWVCPTLHPYGLVLGVVILGYDWLAARSQPASVAREWRVRAGCFMLGCLAVGAWFLTQPDALRQFSANLAVQKSFYQNWNSVVAGLANYRLGGGVILWAGGATAAGALVAGCYHDQSQVAPPLPPAIRFLAPALFATVIGVHTVTRCENFHYLAFGAPFAAIMVCVVAAGVSGERRSPAIVLGLLVLLHATILPYRLLQFIRAGCPDFNAEIVEVLGGIPANRAVYIPHLFWAAAANDHKHSLRWWTLPLASPRQVRQRYEHLAYAAAKPGDILIVDNTSAAATDRFGVLPTFPLQPPDPTLWQRLYVRRHLCQAAVPWGLDLTVYEFAGHP